MKCLILGGGGFLGSHLCDALLAEGHSVRIFDRPNLQRFRTFSADENVEWLEGDFANEDDIAHAVPGCDIVYHLVSTTLPKSSNDNPVYDVETNLVGTLNLLNHTHKAKIKKIIFLSSGGTVYGVPETIPIKENHPSNPICSYGITKLAIEKYFHLYHTLYGLDYCVLRLANPYGERQRVTGAQGAVAVFLDKALRGETIEIWGDGSVVRDYIYIADAVTAMLSALDYDGNERLFNVGSGKGQSLNEILDEIESLLGRPVERKHTPGRALDVPSNVLGIEQAESCLQWRPGSTFQQGLKRTLEWMIKSGADQ
jgi:UDP-glucose 4-epimerase